MACAHKNSAQLRDLYLNLSETVFSRGFFGKTAAILSDKAMYSAEPLEELLEDVLGDTKMTSVKDVRVRLLA